MSWSHYTELLPIKDFNEMLYYLEICVNQGIDVRSLRNKIKSNEYGRLPVGTRQKIAKNESLTIKDLVPNPIVIKAKNNIDIISERVLHNLILEDIESFMKELCNNFSFIGSEYKIKLGDRFNYIDLLLYNIEFNCYVVVELKITDLKKEHIGQIEVYMNYIDKNIKKINKR